MIDLPEKMRFSVIVTYDDYIVRDHQLFQVRAVPGVTFLDLIYRFLRMRKLDPQDFEVRNVIFKRPVTPTENHEQKVVVNFEKKGNTYHFIAKSVSLEHGKEGDEWIENLTGELVRVERLPAQRIDAAQLIRRADRTTDIDYVYSHSRKSGLYHYDFMKLSGNVYNGDGYALADARISELAEQYIDSFYLHPAFLDGALAVPGTSILPNVTIDYDTVKPFIPLYITSFRAFHPLEAQCYIYIDENKIDLAASRDLMYFDVEIYNKNGVLAAKYTRFAAKQVRSEERVRTMVTEIDQPDSIEQTRIPVMSKQKTEYLSSTNTKAVINLKKALTEKESEELKRKEPSTKEKTVSEKNVSVDADGVKEIIRNEIAQMLQVDINEVDSQKEFYDFGLESKDILGMVERLQETFQVELYPTLLFEYTTPDALAEYLIEECHVGVSSPKQDMGDVIAKLLSDKIGIPEKDIEREKEFYDFGLESKDLLELVEKLQEIAKIELYPTVLFEYTNINSLAEYINTNTLGEVTTDIVKKHDVVEEEEVTETMECDDVNFTYHTIWTPSKVKDQRQPSLTNETILIVSTKASERLAKELKSEIGVIGGNCKSLYLGNSTQERGDGSYEVDIDDLAAIKEVVSQFPSIHSIYFFGGIQENDTISSLDTIFTSYEEKRKESILAFFRLIKGLFRAKKFLEVKEIKVVVNNIWNVTGQDHILPYAAGLSGFTKSLAKEYIKKKVFLIDVDYSATDEEKDLQEMARLLIQESECQEDVAYRFHERYTRKIQKCNYVPSNQILLKENGVYILFGGTGGIGMETAKHLASQYHAKIVLVNRKELTKEQEEMVHQIESMGGMVKHFIADMTKQEKIQSVISSVKELYGKIDGVFHSAIVLKDKPIKTMDEELLCKVLEPKDLGTISMLKALKEETLDFIVFYSSAQSYMGSFGQANYAAACTAKDALANSFQQFVGYPVYVINWGYWGSVGIVAKDQYRDSINTSGILSILPEEGMHILDLTLSHQIDHVIAIKFNKELESAIVSDDYKAGIILPRSGIGDCKDVQDQLLEEVSRETIFEDNYDKEAWSSFTKTCNGLILDAFWRMGVFAQAGEQMTVDELYAKLQIDAEYKKMYVALLDILKRAEFIQIEGDKITVLDTVEDPELQKFVSTIYSALTSNKEQYPQLAGYCNLLERCAKSYSEVLTGKKSYVSVMFPRGSFELVEKIYAGNVITDYYNQMIAKIVANCVAKMIEKDANRKINILEAGAGTGGTSVFVVEALKPYASHIHYYYTDVSIEFTKQKDQAFCEEYPFVTFAEFNLEKDIRTQGYDLGQMDIVFASNVLHATSNISKTMYHLKQMLKQKGLLLVNEATQRNDIVTMIFGLTNGWWAYQDDSIRIANTPLLDVKTWKHVFARYGYKNTWVAELPAGLDASAGQSIIIGESDGYLSEIEDCLNYSFETCNFAKSPVS